MIGLPAGGAGVDDFSWVVVAALKADMPSVLYALEAFRVWHRLASV